MQGQKNFLKMRKFKFEGVFFDQHGTYLAAYVPKA
jgi:hypothetical protein